jgi:hypothetical protein
VIVQVHVTIIVAKKDATPLNGAINFGHDSPFLQINRSGCEHERIVDLVIFSPELNAEVI